MKKADLKNTTFSYTWHFARNVDLASFKSDVINLDIGKLENTPVDLSKLSDVVKIMFLRRKNMINWLKTKCYSDYWY